MTIAAMSGVPFKLQDAATTGNGNVLAILPSFRNHTWIITGAGTVTTGTIQIEASNDPADTGVWAAIGALTTILSATDLMIQATGIFNFVRARIVTNVTGAGGSVTVIYEGAKSY
jgi:hypothetical protein